MADGNHRLQALNQVGYEGDVPCLIYDKADLYEVAVKANKAAGTLAKNDLFDWLTAIEALSNEGFTQVEIGEKIGWSRTKVANYKQLIESTVTQILNLAKRHQKGRETKEVTNVTNFTEGWFRTSGIYDLNKKYQLEFMKKFIDNRTH